MQQLLCTSLPAILCGPGGDPGGAPGVGEITVPKGSGSEAGIKWIKLSKFTCFQL